MDASGYAPDGMIKVLAPPVFDVFEDDSQISMDWLCIMLINTPSVENGEAQ